MTVTQIHMRVSNVKPISQPTLYAYLKKLRIKPLGVRQCPQRYPDDTADRILVHLGFAPKRNGHATKGAKR